MDGILVINKSAGFTSFDCVAIARRVSGEKKAGHSGTLDPNATGVLVVALGKATRLIEFMDHPLKLYECTAKLGMRTDSADIWGNEIPLGFEPSEFPGLVEVDRALMSFVGDIEQTPPIYSAIKVNGKALYKYAREGKSVEIRKRNVHIESIKLTGYDRENGTLSFSVLCGRGTYIRSICDDLGNLLKTGCVMTSLQRTCAGGYELCEAVPIEKLKTMTADELKLILKPYESAVSSLNKLYLSERQAKLFYNGNNAFSDDMHPEYSEGTQLAVFAEDKLLGISVIENNKYTAYKVFK